MIKHQQYDYGFKEHDDEVQIIFDGAGSSRIGKLADPENKMNPL